MISNSVRDLKVVFEPTLHFVIDFFFTKSYLSQANETFDYVISAGRDRRIYKTYLRHSNDSSLITEEQNPVLKICPNPNFSGIWVATDESNINYYVS